MESEKDIEFRGRRHASRHNMMNEEVGIFFFMMILLWMN